MSVVIIALLSYIIEKNKLVKKVINYDFKLNLINNVTRRKILIMYNDNIVDVPN